MLSHLLNQGRFPAAGDEEHLSKGRMDSSKGVPFTVVLFLKLGKSVKVGLGKRLDIVKTAYPNAAVKLGDSYFRQVLGPVGSRHKSTNLTGGGMAEDGKSRLIDAERLGFTKEISYGLATVADNGAQSLAWCQSIVQASHMHTMPRESLRQKMHQPFIEKKPEAAVNRDEDGRVRRSSHGRKEINGIALLCSVAEFTTSG